MLNVASENSSLISLDVYEGLAHVPRSEFEPEPRSGGKTVTVVVNDAELLGRL